MIGCGGNGKDDGAFFADAGGDALVVPMPDAWKPDGFAGCTPSGHAGACNPLTQCWEGPASEACGSLDTTRPDRGCYGFSSFSCYAVNPDTLELMDRDQPRIGGDGNPYINGCAPGYMPLFYSGTGSTQTLCTGLCAALDTDNTPSNKVNGLGDWTAPGKLPWQPDPYVGDATCSPTKKGSGPSSRCRFLWPYLVDDVTGEIPPEFVASGFADTLGVCMAIEHFRYDSNGDMQPDKAYPDCATLPPRSAATSGQNDDAVDWGCHRYSSSSPVAPALGDVWMPTGGAVRVVRHHFE
jgi:hypothetical protein